MQKYGDAFSKSSSIFFSSPEPKAWRELIIWGSSGVRPSTLSNMNISETSWPIVNKFHLENHWGGGLTALGFGLDWIRTLVSMATDSSHRDIMGKPCDHYSSFIFDWFFILAAKEGSHKILDGFEIGQYPTKDL